MKGKEQFLERGLEYLVKFLVKDSMLCDWSSNQCGFVAEFACRIAGIGTHTKEAAKKMYQMVTKLDKYDNNPAFKLSPSLVEIQGGDLDVYNSLKLFPAVEIMRLVAASEMDDRSREVRRVHDLLRDHTFEKAKLRECPRTRSRIKILGQVVFHVANEMFCYQEDKWFELWAYIASECQTEFKKTYIFQCLTMMLDDKKICNSYDCINSTRHKQKVKPTKRAGVVRRTSRDMERIVKKQCDWYDTLEYKFAFTLEALRNQRHDIETNILRLPKYKQNQTFDSRWVLAFTSASCAVHLIDVIRRLYNCLTYQPGSGLTKLIQHRVGEQKLRLTHFHSHLHYRCHRYKCHKM
ncbi:hypothetical protein AALP_AA6G355800 [Arabis alpina]|uniref:DUF577 domain-containing protein n=1 Tax=Arabis alpina TaxID=50452 RepID=A0A087GTT8_ARAAL|nr:hypothetical protein AALP_AA6G355800 [Arabis alpina]